MHAAGLFDETQDDYNRSQWFEHVFDNKTKFFCARSSEGAFFCPSNEIEFLNPWDNRYVEGNAWHYRFFVPHNTPHRIKLFGDEEIFAQELDIFFMCSRLWSTTVLPNPYYWPGNEHDLLSVWQFNYANRSDLTQKHSRWILDHVYTINPDGLPGTMIMEHFQHGSHIYRYSRNNGQSTVTSITHNNSAENIYVQRVLLNGKLLSTFPFIDLIEHLKCTTQSLSIQLDLFMSSTPS
ncbi:unnamed protein product [Rotaria magnacalcarata]|nr:unnamed protein product [Rotaria magnacalcarata]